MTTEAMEIHIALPTEALFQDDNLKMSVEIYEETLLLRRFEHNRTTVKMVSADDLALAFTKEVSVLTPVLGPNTLWWKHNAVEQKVALWREPRVWPVAIHSRLWEKPQRLRIPMPGLVFVCTSGQPPRLYAAKERPKDAKDMLYKAPTFNTYADGGSCTGTHRYPTDVNRIPESFFEAFFSMTGDVQNRSKKHPDALLTLWEELDGETEYPYDDLVSQCEVGRAMAA